MRLLVSFAMPLLLGCAAFAQDRDAHQSETCSIHKLAIVSPDLPASEQEAIVHAFVGGKYNLEELTERIRFKLRDSGYELADVQSPQITSESGDAGCDLTFSIHAGDLYRLGGITFTGAKVFPIAELRAQFHLKDRDVFNAMAIGKGLNSLKDLYGSAGYPDFGAIPKPIFDSSHHDEPHDRYR